MTTFTSKYGRVSYSEDKVIFWDGMDQLIKFLKDFSKTRAFRDWVDLLIDTRYRLDKFTVKKCFPKVIFFFRWDLKEDWITFLRLFLEGKYNPKEFGDIDEK